MSCYRIAVSYNGRHFNGWQRLPGSTRPTVQGTLERALSSLAGEQVEVTASGRTDAGVSARAQVCSFHCDRQFTRDDLPGINGSLPAAVSVTDIEPADDRFNARIHARSKTYRYTLWTGESNPGMYSDTAFACGPLEDAVLERVMARFIGRHDFNPFASRSDKKNTVRTVSSISFERDGGILNVFITGDGFLYNMVRNIIGVSVACARGELPETRLDEALADRNADIKGFRAPAQGLCLWLTEY